MKRVRFVVVAGEGAAAVDAVGRYEFSGGLLTPLTSYAVELDPAAAADRA
ncbi:hypothetical protein [Modestobacter excelsi]|nr:hypothetical protein [Modestobacter excelsi]